MPDTSDIELSLVMPCLNEAETLATCIRKARQALDQLGIRGEIVIGDNGSTDGSQEIARGLGARVIDIPVRGYGAALMGAIAAARGRYIIMGDSDDSYDWTDLQPFVTRLREGYDLVMGNRFKGGIKPGAMHWLNRYIGNPILSALGRLFFRTPAADFHCGMRGFSKAAAEKMDLHTTGMEFASEMVVVASLLDLKTCEVPITLSPDGRNRPPHLRRWRDGWRHLRFMLIYSPRWLFLIPGLTLMLIGFAICGWLFEGPRKVREITFDVHTMLYAAMMVLMGFQTALFAVFTKIFSISAGLLPKDPRVDRMFAVVSLEMGLVIGGLLIVVGLAGSVLALWHWRDAFFGPLLPSETLRMVIPSLMALVLGIQIIFASFFLSVLGMKRK
jgi:glycosyltransferase involved in cell wall biosynthesis